MGTFETAVSTSNSLADYTANKFMSIASGYDDTVTGYINGTEVTTQKILDAVSGMLEQALQSLLTQGVESLYNSMGINTENLQLAKDVLNLAGGAVEKLRSIVSILPMGVSVTPSTKECMTSLCKSFRDMMIEQYKSLKLIYDETVGAAITCMGNVVEIAKESLEVIIEIITTMIDEQVYQWTGYHFVEIMYMCQQGIALYRQYREARKAQKEQQENQPDGEINGADYSTKTSVSLNAEDFKIRLMAWVKDQNDALYNAFMMLMMQDIISDLKEDLAKLTNIDITLLADNVNSLDDAVTLLESLGLNDDTPGLALTEIINRGLNGIASTVSALNTINENAMSLATPSTATSMAGMLIANTSVTITKTLTYEFFSSNAGDHTEVMINIYQDPTKGSILKNITKKLSDIKYESIAVFENSQLKKITDTIVNVCTGVSSENEINIIGKMNGMPRPYVFKIMYMPEPDSETGKDTVQQNEANPELDMDNFVVPEIPEVEERIYTTAEKKQNTFQLVKTLFNTFKPMCELMKQLAKLIQNYKINKAKVQGNGHRNIGKGLAKIMEMLGLTNKIKVDDKNVFTVRTYELYTFCINRLRATPNASNIAQIGKDLTKILMEEYIEKKIPQSLKMFDEKKSTLLYFDLESIRRQHLLNKKPERDGYMTNMDNIRIIDGYFYYTPGGKSTLTSQIVRAIQRKEDPFKNNYVP